MSIDSENSNSEAPLVEARAVVAAPDPAAAEVIELRARVQHLEQTQQEMRQRHLADLKALRQSQHLLNAILDNSTAMIFAKDLGGRFIMVNKRFEVVMGRQRGDVLGKTAYDILSFENAEKMTEEDRVVQAGNEAKIYDEDIIDATGARCSLLTIKFPLTDATGAVTGLCGIATDVTEIRRAAEERTTMQQQIIDSQQAALRELSTPLIPLADGVLVVPLIGAIDDARSQQIVEVLLEGVAAQRAHTVIVDITGVRAIDKTVARGLISAARATRLLGARVVLTGLRADLAQALVHLDADLSDIVTLSTLQSGISYAMQSRR